jgi:hypothetical protein
MKTKAFWAGLCLLFLTACGPMIGGMMVAGNGIKDFKVIQGDLATLAMGSQVVVLGPFDKTDQAFYICRGEDAATFASAFNQFGLFSAELDVDTRFPEKPPVTAQFKGRTSSDVQQALGLKKAPDLVMSGTILSRSMTAAPANGVIMTSNYRLEILKLSDGQTTVIEITVQDMFQDVIPSAVKHLAEQMGRN